MAKKRQENHQGDSTRHRADARRQERPMSGRPCAYQPPHRTGTRWRVPVSPERIRGRAAQDGQALSTRCRARIHRSGWPAKRLEPGRMAIGPGIPPAQMSRCCQPCERCDQRAAMRRHWSFCRRNAADGLRCVAVGRTFRITLRSRWRPRAMDVNSKKTDAARRDSAHCRSIGT